MSDDRHSREGVMHSPTMDSIGAKAEVAIPRTEAMPASWRRSMAKSALVLSATGVGAPTTAEVPAKKAVASVAKKRKCIVDEYEGLSSEHCWTLGALQRRVCAFIGKSARDKSLRNDA